MQLEYNHKTVIDHLIPQEVDFPKGSEISGRLQFVKQYIPMPFEEFLSWHIVKGLVQWIADVWYEELLIIALYMRMILL